jgi:hypothetical protein
MNQDTCGRVARQDPAPAAAAPAFSGLLRVHGGRKFYGFSLLGWRLHYGLKLISLTLNPCTSFEFSGCFRISTLMGVLSHWDTEEEV